MRKQITVYLNLDNEDEKLIYDYLSKKNKNTVIKRAVLNEIKGTGFINTNTNSNSTDNFEIEEGIFNEM